MTTGAALLTRPTRAPDLDERLADRTLVDYIEVARMGGRSHTMVFKLARQATDPSAPRWYSFDILTPLPADVVCRLRDDGVTPSRRPRQVTGWRWHRGEILEWMLHNRWLEPDGVTPTGPRSAGAGRRSHTRN